MKLFRSIPKSLSRTLSEALSTTQRATAAKPLQTSHKPFHLIRNMPTPTIRGLAFRELGEYDKAVADFSNAIRLEPNDADGYYEQAALMDNIASMTRPSLTTTVPSD